MAADHRYLSEIARSLDVLTADARLNRVEKELDRELEHGMGRNDKRVAALEKQRAGLLQTMGIASGRAV